MQKLGSYTSDIASLKVGAKGVSFYINNGKGDGTFDVYLCNAKELPEDVQFVMAFQGENLVLFDYDCGDTPIDGVSLTGSFLAYTLHGDIYLERFKWTNTWGSNITT